MPGKHPRREIRIIKNLLWPALLAILLSGCGAAAGSFKPSPTFPELTYTTSLSQATQPEPGTPIPPAASQSVPGKTQPSPTPFPLSEDAITPAVVGQLAEQFRWGEGIPLSLAGSPDGSLLAFATHGGVEIYDARTFKKIRSIAAAGGFLKITFLKDSQTLAVADWNSRVTLFRVQDGSAIKTLDNGDIGQPLSLVPFAGGRILSLGTTSNLTVLWDLETGKLDRRWITSGASAMTASPDGQYLVSSNFEGSIYLWVAENGHGLGKLWRDSNLECLEFAPDSLTLAACYGDNVVVLWDVLNGKRIFTLLGHTDRAVTAAFSPDGKLLATAGWDQSVRLWDTGSGAEKRVLDGQSGRVRQVIFSSDGKSLIGLFEDGLVRAWSVTTGAVTRETDDFAPLGRAVFSPDGASLATGAEDGTWRLWREADGSLLRSVPAHAGGISALSFSPDGQYLATGGLDKAVRIWRTADGSLVRELKDNEGWINSLDFSPDGGTLAASASGAAIQLWSMNGSFEETHFDTGGETVLKIAFDPDGVGLWTAAMDGSLKKWRYADGALLGTYLDSGPFISSLAFPAAGDWLAAGGDGQRISEWQLSDSGLFRMIDAGKKLGVSSLAYSPDGRLLFASFWDKTLRVYLAQDSSLLKEWKFDYNVRDLDVSPDGSRLAISLDDGTVRLWGIK